MRNGTQEELDAAREDATLLPFNVVYKSKFLEGKSHYDLPDVTLVTRGHANADHDGSDSVAFSLLDYSDYWYVSAEELEVIHD